MKKRIVSIFLTMIMCFSMISVYQPVYAESFLTDAMAQKFVSLFYRNGSVAASKAKNILTGKETGTTDEIKEIYRYAAQFYGIVNQYDMIEDLFSGSTATAMESIGYLVRFVSGALTVYDNISSFANSEISMQRTVDAFQTGIGVLSTFGLSNYIPSNINFALSAIELGLTVGGLLQTAYLDENYTLYQNELMMAYYAQTELPYQTAPKLLLGSKLQQEQADAMYANLYMEFVLKRISSNIGSSAMPDPEPEIVYYTITFNSNCSDVSSFSKTIEYGVNVDYVEMERPGYIFQGWYWDADCTSEVTQYYHEDQTWYAKWFPRYYTIIYDSNCNDVADYSYEYDILTDKKVYDYKPVREGYIFRGWYWEPQCQNEVLAPFEIYDGITFYAKWQQRYFTITYDSNCSEVENFYHKYDITTNNWLYDYEMKRPGYMFLGWYWDSACTNPVSGSFTVDQDMHLYAKWVRQFDYSLSNGKATITNFNGMRVWNGVTESDITIPEKIDGYQIVAIDDSVFSLSSITSITIPDSVTKIGFGAFSGCKKLASITLPKNMQYIDGLVFSGCSSLTYVTIPKSITQIGDRAFYGCSGLAGVYYQGSLLDWNCVDIAAGNTYLTNANIYYSDGISYCTIEQNGDFYWVDLKTTNTPNADVVVMSYDSEGLNAVELPILLNGKAKAVIPASGIDRIKALLWDDMETMKPLDTEVVVMDTTVPAQIEGSGVIHRYITQYHNLLSSPVNGKDYIQTKMYNADNSSGALDSWFAFKVGTLKSGLYKLQVKMQNSSGTRSVQGKGIDFVCNDGTVLKIPAGDIVSNANSWVDVGDIQLSSGVHEFIVKNLDNEHSWRFNGFRLVKPDYIVYQHSNTMASGVITKTLDEIFHTIDDVNIINESVKVTAVTTARSAHATLAMNTTDWKQSVVNIVGTGEITFTLTANDGGIVAETIIGTTPKWVGDVDGADITEYGELPHYSGIKHRIGTDITISAGSAATFNFTSGAGPITKDGVYGLCFRLSAPANLKVQTESGYCADIIATKAGWTDVYGADVPLYIKAGETITITNLGSSTVTISASSMATELDGNGYDDMDFFPLVKWNTYCNNPDMFPDPDGEEELEEPEFPWTGVAKLSHLFSGYSVNVSPEVSYTYSPGTRTVHTISCPGGNYDGVYALQLKVSETVGSAQVRVTTEDGYYADFNLTGLGWSSSCEQDQLIYLKKGENTIYIENIGESSFTLTDCDLAYFSDPDYYMYYVKAQ